ncbi:uncharacterized protein LOC100890111 [Strongylocentrotus purpuratus]|uniref:EF-hand domain-containing protein n=1 Tax=Strongylocentrotus purpuratus TaxID=7668 RepID=A0A7M7GGX7_STRPU|nr:uncharacterized protein LOC100890111 [Strongylocentrotus purpuratus]XP_011661737.2 uncharacterized protein LOC100890111 [Strongylocentrotus purpuratus]
MGRFTAVALLLAQLIAISLACISSSSGRPGGVDLSDNTEFYPEYDKSRGFIGLGLEHRPSHDVDINVRPRVDISDVLDGRFRPHGDVELQYRPNENTKVDVKVGLDPNGEPRVNAGFTVRFRRSIENDTLVNIDISGKLFEVLDLNGDDQLDVKEWFDDGGKVRPFADMIGDHDYNSDEMISLEEFLAIPVDPALIVAIDQIMRSDQD